MMPILKIRKKRNVIALSLVELLAAVVVLGMISSVSIPLYTRYVKKSQYAELVVLLNGFKSEVTTSYNQTGSFPSSVWDTNLASSRVVNNIDKVSSFVYNTNTIRAEPSAYWGFIMPEYGANAHLYMCMRPNTTTGLLDIFCGPWRASSDSEAIEFAKVLPKNCRDDIAVECFD